MYNFLETEKRVLSFWRENSIFEKSLEIRKNARRFVFFEGPPTANGRPGIHHLLARAFKDIFCRYKTMQGFFVLRKAGWDTHGLPVEIEVEKELGFKTKKDIEDYGIDKFNKKAKESVWKYKTEWEEMTRRMGYWLNMDDPYVTYDNNYIESLWNIIQQIWKKKLLYLAHKVVPYCTRCGTSLSSHEVAQGYKTVTDKSVYIKFKLKKGQKIGDLKVGDNTHILAWTTTPWTLPGNVALAVGKDIEYGMAERVENGKKESLIYAKELEMKIFSGADFNTENFYKETFKGSDLIGLEYESLFNIKELKSPTSYKIYDADFVSTEDGTGVVHTAVMYGEDDYDLGTKLDLPKHHTVNEQGKFVGVGKDFDGMVVKHKDKSTEEKTTQKIIDYLKNENLLLKEEDYEHEYPFCWRCDSPLLYYAKDSWFIKMSSVRDQLLKNNQKINWYPEHIKDGRFGQWLKEGKDWAFSRERYWGTPLPIWKCQKCEFQKVIGSVDELIKYSTTGNSKRNNYYTLRHSYTTRDERGKMIVSTDINSDKYHLTQEGRDHIGKTAEKIKNNYDIDLIYTSPFIRTAETAEIVGKLLHLKVNKDERLREIGHGGCEGKSYQECREEIVRKNIYDKPHPLAESWNDTKKRMVGFIKDMEAKYSGKNILIVSHGDPIWLLNCAANGANALEIESSGRGGRFYYPGVGEFVELDWKLMPRNEDGELDLHRPYIDDVYLKCDECGASMKKVPDLIDVWFDSGAMPYAQWHYPFENKKMAQEQFPADFIVEAIDQTRGWFYTLLAISTLLGKGNPYRNVMSLGHVLDEKGKKMSKSKGNVVSPFEVMDKVGADTARWYFFTLNQPGEYKNFSIRDLEAKLKGFVFTIQNCIRFYELYISDQPQDIRDFKPKNLLDKWIVSKLNRLIDEVTDSLDKYDLTTSARLIEKFVVEDLSNWWLRRSRKRKEALDLLRFILLQTSKLIAPFMPFMAEDMYGRLINKKEISQSSSVHLQDWPKANKKIIDKKLDEEMGEVRNIVTAGLAIRKDKQLKVRQPLMSVTVKTLKFHKDLEELIKDELNVKEVKYDKKQESDVILETELTTVLITEGYARELIRQIQDMRKEAKYKLDAQVYCQWHSEDKELSEAILSWGDEIKKEALLSDLMNRQKTHKTYDVEKEFDLAPQRKIWIGVKR